MVPTVFIFDGSHFFLPLDAKRKKAKPENLRRIKNLPGNPNVTLLIDEYGEDSTRLAFVMIQGTASVMESRKQADIKLRQAQEELATKYIQYQKIGIDGMRIMIKPEKVVSWRSSALSCHLLLEEYAMSSFIWQTWQGVL